MLAMASIYYACGIRPNLYRQVSLGPRISKAMDACVRNSWDPRSTEANLHKMSRETGWKPAPIDSDDENYGSGNVVLVKKRK